MRMKNVISWSLILLLTIIPLGGCAVNSSILFVDTNETEYYESNGLKDENQTEIISFENYTEDYDLNITNAEIQLNQTFDSAATSVSLKTPVVYVDTDGTGNYNCDGTNDHVQINQALSYISGRGGGTVYLRGPNTYWIDSTLNIGADTLLTGDSTAEIKLVANAGWASQVPLIRGATGADNIVITGFTIDGNSESQSGISKGQGYYNLIHFQSSNNIEVSHMRMEWGTGDGMKVYNGNGIKFLYNDVYKLGHDALYAISCSNVEHAYNTIMTRTNSGCRYSDGCTDSTIHDNLIYSSLSGDSTGPAIQISTSSTSNCVFDDIEVYNNRIHTTNGAGIWMTANYQDDVVHARDVHIHHNIFTKVGQYSTNTGFSNAAIVLGDFDNTIIENNVFDDGGHAAIKWYLRDGRRQQKIDFTTYVRNNIIMNNDGVSSITGSGVGIWNTNPTYCNFVVQNNDIYNNKNGQTYGGSFTMKNNLNVDPLCVDSTNSNLASRDYHLRSKAGRYSSGKWIADSVSSPLIDAGYSSSSYSSEPSPNGGKINIGRYGNTVQASKSGSSASTTDNSPVANAGADKTATVGSVVSFDASASTDDKGIASYSWDFDASNGITSEATGKTATKTYTTAGTYTVTLAVTDTGGQESTDTLNVVVSTTPVTNTELDLAIYDNRLRETAPTTVYSDSNYIDIGQSGTRYRDVMWFDLSEYKTTDIVSKATLSLYWYYPAGATRTSDTVVEIYRPLEWDPKYVSWNSRTSTSAWTTAGGNWYDKNGVAQGSTPYASLTFPAGTMPGNKYYDLDVTQLVQEFVSCKNKNTGFFLKAKTESGNYIAFYSSEWSNAAQRPKLTVTIAEVSDNVPVANAGADKTATTGSTVSFDGNASTDDKGIASYLWDFDASNGITAEATGKTATKTYTTAGTYTVTLTVTDTSGQKATDTVNVVVSTTPVTNTELGLATYDNRLREAASTTVYSDSSYLDIGKSTSACRDIMWFDLSEYNTTDTVSKATLSLYWYYPAGKTRTSDTVVEVYRPVEWDPKYVSWNNRASGTPWTTAGGNWYDKNGVAQGSTPYASLTFPASTLPGNKYYEFDVTQLVQEYVSGKNKNTGFFLKAKTENNNYIAFYSSEWTNAVQKPKLTVTVAEVSDNAPVANAGADKTATTGSAVTFDGSASTDDKGIASYSWDFDASNGITAEATGKTATKTYTTAGTYTVTLTVTDTSGQKATDTVNVVVSTTPVTNTELGLVTYDNRLRETSPSTVYSDSNYIDIGQSGTRYRDVMWFNLSEYDSTDTVSKATLSLYWYYPAGATRTSDTVVEIYRPLEWDPKYVSWNSRTSTSAWTTAGGNWYDKNGVAQGSTPYATLTFPAKTVPGNKYYEFDVTQLVQEYVSGKNKNTGFFLKAKTESNNYIAFYSSEWTNAAQRPKLTVTTGTSSIPVDNLPVANAGADKTATTGSAVTFDGSASTDDKGIASYSWDFDASNGITAEATGKTATKTYTAAGTYTVTLTVTDTSGQKATDTVKVVVSTTPATKTEFDLCDNRLVESSKTTVYSSSNYLDIGKSSTRCRDLIWFDLSEYKTTDTVSKATLSLYWYYPTDATRTSDTVVEIYRPVEWDPKYVSWNSRTATSAWTTAGGNWYDKNGVAQGSTPYASLTFPAKTVPGNKYYEFDVTQLVQEYVSGKNKNTGFFLKSKTENGNYIAFYSSEWSNAAQRPKLTVTATAA